MKNKSKAENERKHFEKRCIERVGEKLNRKEIERKIRAGKLRPYDRQSLRVIRFLYQYKGKEYIIVYDSLRHKAVTIFPKEWVK